MYTLHRYKIKDKRGILMTIKEVSKITGIYIDNLRYYERIGIIPEVPRNKSGIRDYDEMSIHWIELAMRFKKAGMSLENIRKYIQLALEGEKTKDERWNILLETKAQIKQKINDMQETLDIINYKMDNYESKCEPITKELILSLKNKRDGLQNYYIEEFLPPLKQFANLCKMDWCGYVYTGGVSYINRNDEAKLKQMYDKAIKHEKRLLSHINEILK